MTTTKLSSITEYDDYGSFFMNNNDDLNKNKSDGFRWWVLMGCALMHFSIWYSFFIPSGLQTQFITYYNLTNNDYDLLFSISTGPTFIIPIFAGLIVDQIGISLIIFISSSVTIIAQIIFFISCHRIKNSIILMFLSRGILGFGACSWQVAMNSILTKYFKHKELGLSLSISPTMARLGFAAADYISYLIYKISGKDTIIWSVLCNLIILFISYIFIINIAFINWKNSKLRIKPYLIKKTVSHSFIELGYDLKSLPVSLWIILIIAGLGYVPLACWTVIGSDVLKTIYGFNESLSDILLVIPCFATIICSPFVGIFIDKYNKLTYILIISSILYILVHLYIFCGISNDNNNDNNNDIIMIIITMITLGFALAMFATTMWSSIGLIVDSSLIGISNGLGYMMYALCNAGGQLIVGSLTQINNDNYLYKYYYVQIFFVLTSIVMLTFCIILLVYDCCKTKQLTGKSF